MSSFDSQLHGVSAAAHLRALQEGQEIDAGLGAWPTVI
jgi:hypothetical protein